MTLRAIMRVGDIVEGTCYAHDSPRPFTGVFTNGSGIGTADGLAIIRVGDTGDTDCGHHFRAVTGASNSTCDGIPIHRVGDTGVVIEDERGTFTSIQGSPVGSCE